MTTDLSLLSEEQLQDQAADDMAADDYATSRGGRTYSHTAVSIGPDGSIRDGSRITPVDLSEDSMADLPDAGARRSTRLQRARLQAFTADVGDGFLVRRMSTPDHLLEVCRVCGAALPLPPDPCEFAETPPERARTYRGQVHGLPVRSETHGFPMVTVVPGNAPDRPCRCNGCQTKGRSAGNQPELCSDACKKIRKKQTDALAAEKGREADRQKVRDALAINPGATTEDLMTLTGVIRKRVTEVILTPIANR